MTEATSSGLSLFPHFVVDDIFNLSSSLEPKSIPSAVAPPVDQAAGHFPLFFETLGTQLCLPSAPPHPPPDTHTPCSLAHPFSCSQLQDLVFLLSAETSVSWDHAPCSPLNEPAPEKLVFSLNYPRTASRLGPPTASISHPSNGPLEEPLLLGFKSAPSPCPPPKGNGHTHCLPSPSRFRALPGVRPRL